MSLADNNYCFIDHHSAHLAELDHNSPLPNADFNVTFYAYLTHVPFSVFVVQEQHDLMSDDYDVHTFRKSFKTKSHLLILEDDASCASNISNMLSEVNFPEYTHQDCIRLISKAAQRIAAGAQQQKPIDSTLTMSVHVGFVVCDETEDFEEDVVEEGELSANKTAVDPLEKVIVKEEEGEVSHESESAICLEEIRVGSECTQMPFTRMFHGGCICIVCWLEKSELCPLSGYEMP